MEISMSNKKKLFTISTALYLLLSPNISFSETIVDDIDRQFRLYISGQYKPSLSVFSNFSVKETNVTTKYLTALKKDADPTEKTGSTPHEKGLGKPDNFNIPYKVEFEDNAVSFSGAVGFSYPEGLRIEIEASYEEFDVKNPGGYTISNAFRYFALVRESESSKEPQPKNPNSAGNNKIFHTVMRNDGVAISSITINGCYDFSLSQLPVLPYICGGIGIDTIDFFDALHIKFAGQGKLGITYPLSGNINLFADGYYHKVISNQFKNLNVQHVAELNDDPKVTSAVATLNISYFGGEIGVRYIF
uniref:Omp-1-13 n=1 Tax=Ehrlichia ewingii TaxID=947 RepID=B1N6B6_9RICK|nr:Omp-1-13 [Ehrlichia ewingii]